MRSLISPMVILSGTFNSNQDSDELEVWDVPVIEVMLRITAIAAGATLDIVFYGSIDGTNYAPVQRMTRKTMIGDYKITLDEGCIAQMKATCTIAGGNITFSLTANKVKEEPPCLI